MHKITKVIKRNYDDTDESITLKIDAYIAYVKNNQLTADIFSLNNGSLLLTRYKKGRISKVKLFNSCDVDKIIQAIS